jgi:protein required for attachment to host cells
MTTWIVVADESRARLFETGVVDGALSEIADIGHPEGRMHDREMTRGPLPASHESVGPVSHGIEPHTSVREKVSMEFAREIAVLLEHGRVNHAYDALVLVAEPRFLGVLRSSIGHQVSKLLVGSIGKGVSQANPDEIRKVLTELED